MTESCLLQYLSSLKWDKINIDKYFTFTAWHHYYCIIQSNMMIIMVINIMVHVDVTVFPYFSWFVCLFTFVFMSQWNNVKNKQPIIIFINAFCILKLTYSIRLVQMTTAVDNISKKSWRPTVLQEDIWVRTLKAVREDEAEEWGDDKGVVTLLTSLSVQTHSDAGNLSWMRPICSKTDWNRSSFWRKVQKVH